MLKPADGVEMPNSCMISTDLWGYHNLLRCSTETHLQRLGNAFRCLSWHSTPSQYTKVVCSSERLPLEEQKRGTLISVFWVVSSYKNKAGSPQALHTPPPLRPLITVRVQFEPDLLINSALSGSIINMQQKNFPIFEKLENNKQTNFLDRNFPFFSLLIVWLIFWLIQEKNNLELCCSTSAKSEQTFAQEGSW